MASCGSRWLRCIRCFTGWRRGAGCGLNGKPRRRDDAGAAIAWLRRGRRSLRRCARNGRNYFERCGSSRRWPMPDWETLVSRRLAGLALEGGERGEVIKELAGHLEEIYEASRQEGASDDEASRCALLQVENWDKLQRQIHVARRKENAMNARTSRVWLPSLLTLAASFITLVAFGVLGLPPGPLGLRPHHEEWSSHLIGGIIGGLHFVNEYTAWAMGLAVIGAVGGGLSQRAGGTRREITVS